MGFNGFELDEDLKDLKELVRRFTDRELRPLVDQMDQEGLELPEEIWRKMGDMGLFGFTVGEEYGGHNMGYLAMAVAMEEVAKAAGCLYSPIAGQNGAYNAPILHLGTPEQKAKYVPGVVKGIVKGAFALTEPNAGSDAGSMRTTAVDKGDHYLVNGQKTFITNADRADFLVTFCRSDNGPVCLIVDKDTEGLVIAPTEHKMGFRGIGLNTVFYTNCRIPKENLLGEVGKGFEAAKVSLGEARMSVAAGAIGLAQEAIDLAVTYSKQRVQFGKTIAQFQNTQFVLAECQTKVDAARLLLYRCAAALDAGKHEQYLSSMAKYYAAEIANDVARKCLQVYGGYGYCAGYGVERIYRDVKVFEIFDGTTEVHKMIISKWMGVR